MVYAHVTRWDITPTRCDVEWLDARALVQYLVCIDTDWCTHYNGSMANRKFIEEIKESACYVYIYIYRSIYIPKYKENYVKFV